MIGVHGRTTSGRPIFRFRWPPSLRGRKKADDVWGVHLRDAYNESEFYEKYDMAVGSNVAYGIAVDPKMLDVVDEDDSAIDKDKEMLHGSRLAAAMSSSLP